MPGARVSHPMQKISTWLVPLLALLLIRATGSFQLAAPAAFGTALIAQLGLSHAEIGMLMGAFMLPGIFVTVAAGLLATRIGDRKVLLGGMALMATGAAACAVATGLPGLLAGRVLSGIGGVAMLMLVLKMTTDRFAGPMLSTATSVVIVSWPTGFALSLAVFGPLAVNSDVATLFLLSGAPALVAIGLIGLVGHAKPAPMPIAGARSLVGWQMILAAALSWSALNAATAVMAGFLQTYLVETGHDPAANQASVSSWCFAAATPFGGLVADRLIGRKAAVVAGILLTTAGFLAIPLTGGHVVALGALGVAIALIPGAVTAQVGAATPPAARAVVFGWYSAGSYLGLTIAPWIAGRLHDLTDDARAPIWFGAAVTLAMLAPYLWFLRRISRE